jgi:two-component system cell cycle response regulator CtrA
MRVLLVEDDAATAQSMELMMRIEGMRVYVTDLGEEAIDLVQLYDYDVLLLDLNLPDMSGYQVLREWRAKGVTTPVLVVSGLGEREVAEAREHGADGCCAKPFHKDELMLGIFGVVRKACGNPMPVKIGKLRVDIEARRARMGKAPLFLTDDEYRALELMALRRGVSLHLSELGRYLFGGLGEGRAAELKEVMRTLRLKLRLASGGREYIRPGQPGIYCWASDVEGG